MHFIWIFYIFANDNKAKPVNYILKNITYYNPIYIYSCVYIAFSLPLLFVLQTALNFNNNNKYQNIPFKKLSKMNFEFDDIYIFYQNKNLGVNKALEVDLRTIS